MLADKQSEDAPPEFVVARLSRIDSRSDDEKGMSSLEFDALLSDIPEIAPPPNPKLVSKLEHTFRGIEAIRAQSSKMRFFKFCGVLPEVGDWFVLTLVSKKPEDGIPAFRSPFTADGFVTHFKAWISDVTKLFDEREDKGHPRSLGAASNALIDWGLDVAAKSNFPSAAICTASDLDDVFSSIQRPTRISIRDVGQASFSRFEDDNGTPLLYCDVGWPLSFNKKTIPKYFSLDFTRAPIVLTHWDWDHLHYALRRGGEYLSECIWVCPVQNLGPGAARFANYLNSRGLLKGWSGGTYSLAFGQIANCTGRASDTNDSGLALRVELKSGRSVVVVGDADYTYVPIGFRVPVDCLVATHHGARIKSPLTSLPKPMSSQHSLIFSFGAGNIYKHPHLDALQKYKAAGWRRQTATAMWRTQSRGDKFVV